MSAPQPRQWPAWTAVALGLTLALVLVWALLLVLAGPGVRASAVPGGLALAVWAMALAGLAWRARDFRRVRGTAALCRAMRRTLAREDALPCSLLRLHLSGGGRRLPWPEVLPSLQARTRRRGDRLARCGQRDAALWMVNTDARAADGFVQELRAELACVLARHDLHCWLGQATQEQPGGDARALWDAARPADPTGRQRQDGL